jgi:hypothetical protein
MALLMRPKKDLLFRGSKQWQWYALTQIFLASFQAHPRCNQSLDLRQLDDYALVLCYPDALANNAVVKVVNYLRASGLHLFAFKLTTLTPTKLWRLRRYEARRRQRYETQIRDSIELHSVSICLRSFRSADICGSSIRV